MRHSRRGFTLIEILIVIGIIMLLMGLLVVGFRHINAVAARRETTAELKICKAMFAEYENHNGLLGIPTTSTPLAFGDFDSNNSTDMSDRSANTNPRYASNAVKQTMNVMGILMQMPTNRTEAQNLPTKKILEGAPPSGGGAVTPPSITQVVILDGWNNPIIFVPAGGLIVKIDNVDYLVRTSGTHPFPSGSTPPPLTPADRPFFASAGQDGAFYTDHLQTISNGGDNVYSFQD